MSDQLLVFAVEEPDRWTVGFPPKGVRNGFWGFGNVVLHGDDAALVVYAHYDTHYQIKTDPDVYPGFGLLLREADGGEEEGDGGEEEACFLVGEDGEEDYAGEGGEECHGHVGGAEEEEERERGTEELGEVDEEVLVEGVDAMFGEIGGIGVVEEIIEWCDDGVVEDACKGKFAGGIKRRVDADGNEGA